MVDEDGRCRKSLSLSPKHNPLEAFLGAGSETDDDDTGRRATVRNRGTSDSGDVLVPQQRPSIIDERATVRYYCDAQRDPIIFSEGQQGTVKRNVKDAEDKNAPVHFDVALRLDMTTGCGGKIWPAAEVLGQYIASHRSEGEWAGKTIVELGSGTGLVGLLAGQLPGVARVWITDQIPMMPLMKQNLGLNPALADCVVVEELNWGKPISETVPQYPDVLLLADCVYLEVAFQPLVDAMCAMTTKDTEVLFCYQQRRKADKRFFKLLRKHFLFADVADDDPARRQQYNRQGTRLYRVTRR